MKTETKALNRFVQWKIAALAALAFTTLASTPALAGDNDNDGDDFKFDLVRSNGLANFSMSRHRALAKIDSEAVFVHKGKLYVCTTKRGLKIFSSDPDTNIKKADDNWQLYQLPSSPGFNRYFGS